MTKTLIVVGSVPGGANVGQILLRDMLASLPKEDYFVAALLDPKEQSAWQEQNPEPPANLVFFLNRPSEHAVRPWNNRAGGLWSGLKRRLSYDRQVKILANRLEQYIGEVGITRLWGILNMTTVVDVLFDLGKRCDLPLLTQVWDDIDYLTQQRGLDSTLRQRTQKRFGHLLAKSVKTAVICEAMAKHYSKYSGDHCEIIRHGLADQVTAQTDYTSPAEFSIGFSGGMYAPEAWQALFEALAYLNWQVAGKSIKLVVLSGKITLPCRSPANVQYLGWRNTEEVRSYLAQCDLLYVPYPFASHLRPLAQLSFPTKLSTYVSLGRPVFAHVPQYGSLVDFYDKYPLGALCTSLDAKVIAEKIAALAEDTNLYEASAKTVAWVGEKELSQANFVRQVKNFIGAEAVAG
ncbi:MULTISPECIES: glycosyltransferase [unclassified Synechocystis]|uniref:glycosyltransferase n=1 Tax=unclassified Synechocystis TaxID=2640012 RepID=UPI00040AD3A3|nr:MULTISPECIES: glycosyltransferase [unclassified Synechocystis]AIE74666.1 hypothetical protein D082_21380 [Synechocystis sp. PCC 6714]MCT0253978.1 glycosyltransferase [Synechocystis sp. CS-94]